MRSFPYTPDASFSEEFLLHSWYASFSEEFLLHSWYASFIQEFLLHSWCKKIVKNFSYTHTSFYLMLERNTHLWRIWEELLLLSSHWF